MEESRSLSNVNVKTRIRQILILVLAIVIGVMISSAVGAQHRFHKEKARHYKSRYQSQIRKADKVCDILNKKRNYVPRAPLFASNRKPKYKPMAEMDPPGTVRAPEPTPAPVVATLVQQHTPESGATSANDLEALHQKEDEVLDLNHLPKPSSAKHEQIRKAVADKIKTLKGGQPVELNPLYFNFDNDEFSIVDMEPFLVAVEYALQGRSVLIEGHTDSKGQSAYNVKLSMKRVEKIRSLMHDMGVPDDRISVVGYGEELAMNDTTSEDARQLNRRVDFKVF
jgi:outer membrane protein OmpA-like peptidoglycan-associated protein